MDIQILKALLNDVKSGNISVDDALEQLCKLPFEDIGFAKIDSHRHIRCGFPEVIFCQGKTIDQTVKIAQRILDDGNNLLATRASKDIYEAIKKIEPSAQYNELARAITAVKEKLKYSVKVLYLLQVQGQQICPLPKKRLLQQR